MLRKFFNRETGQGMVEYALILFLIAVVVIAVLALLGPQIRDVLGRVLCGLGGCPNVPQ